MFDVWMPSKIIAQKHYFDFLAISQKHCSSQLRICSS